MGSELITFSILGQTISIYFYGVFLILSVLIGILVLYKELSRRNLETKSILDNIFWILLFGIMGSRIGYIIIHLDYYIRQPADIFRFWEGGLNFTGGLLAGFITAAIWLKWKYRKEFWSWLDAAMIALMLGHATGMLGSFTSGIDYGKATNLPWGVEVGALNDGILRHPTQIYEFLAYLASFVSLWFISNRLIDKKTTKIFPGFVFLLGFSLTFFIRFMVEFIRVSDSALFRIGTIDITFTHVMSLIMLILGLTLLIYKEKKYLKNNQKI